MRDKQKILFDIAGKKVYACTICEYKTKQKGLLKVGGEGRGGWVGRDAGPTELF